MQIWYLLTLYYHLFIFFFSHKHEMLIMFSLTTRQNKTSYVLTSMGTNEKYDITSITWITKWNGMFFVCCETWMTGFSARDDWLQADKWLKPRYWSALFQDQGFCVGG